MKYVLLFSIVVLAACAHEAVTRPDGPGGAIESVDAQYVYFTAEGHLLWLKEGVPVDLFTLTPKGWAMTPIQWHQGMAIRLKDKNP
jgi:hypothetical protein